MCGPLKGRCLCEDAVYHIPCSSHFQTGKGNLKKSVMPRKCRGDTTVDKECFSKSLNISILTQMNSLILQFGEK